MNLPSLLRDLSEVLLPRRCHICDCTLAESEQYICTSCLSKLPRTLYHRRPGNPMEMRFAGLFPFERATGYFHYSRHSDIAVLIQDFKYRKFRDLGRWLGATVATELYTTGFLSDIDCIVPVPMHYLKKARRGYNPPEQIAIGISRVTDIPVCNSLRARRSHRTQTRLSFEERRINVDDIFQVTDTHELEGKHILLIDDICTTGATLTSAAETILASAPTARLSLFTLCVTF